MPNSQRAKQFAPFDAVVGLRAALKEKEKIKEERKIASEDLEDEINIKLKNLQIDDIVTIYYYNELDENYKNITDRITEISHKYKNLKIGEWQINFKDIFEIK